MQAQTMHAAAEWPPAPVIPHHAPSAAKPRQQMIDEIDEIDEIDDAMAPMLEPSVTMTPRTADEDWMDTVARGAFWQAVDAIRAHADWKPQPAEMDLFGSVVRDIDGKLITELAWVFGAEGESPLPFEVAADAMSVDPARFRRICQRAFPYECAWIEANVGPLQGV